MAVNSGPVSEIINEPAEEPACLFCGNDFYNGKSLCEAPRGDIYHVECMEKYIRAREALGLQLVDPQSQIPATKEQLLKPCSRGFLDFLEFIKQQKISSTFSGQISATPAIVGEMTAFPPILPLPSSPPLIPIEVAGQGIAIKQEQETLSPLEPVWLESEIKTVEPVIPQAQPLPSVSPLEEESIPVPVLLSLPAPSALLAPMPVPVLLGDVSAHPKFEISSVPDSEKLTSEDIFDRACEQEAYCITVLRDQYLWKQLTKEQLIELANIHLSAAKTLVKAAPVYRVVDGAKIGYDINLFELADAILRHLDSFKEENKEDILRLLNAPEEVRSEVYIGLLSVSSISRLFLESYKAKRLVEINAIHKDAISKALISLTLDPRFEAFISELIRDERICDEITEDCVFALLRKYPYLRGQIVQSFARRLAPRSRQWLMHHCQNDESSNIRLEENMQTFLKQSFTIEELLGVIDYKDFCEIFRIMSSEQQQQVMSQSSKILAERFTTIQILELCYVMRDIGYFSRYYNALLENKYCSAGDLMRFLFEDPDKRIRYISDSKINETLKKWIYDSTLKLDQLLDFIKRDSSRRFLQSFQKNMECTYFLIKSEEGEAFLSEINEMLQEFKNESKKASCFNINDFPVLTKDRIMSSPDSIYKVKLWLVFRIRKYDQVIAQSGSPELRVKRDTLYKLLVEVIGIEKKYPANPVYRLNGLLLLFQSAIHDAEQGKGDYACLGNHIGFFGQIASAICTIDTGVLKILRECLNILNRLPEANIRQTVGQAPKCV